MGTGSQLEALKNNMHRSVASFTERGFNLLELMVTLAIAGVLLALAFPSFQSILGGSAIVATTNDFVSSIHAARSEAVKRGGRAGLCPSANPTAAAATCSTTADWTSGWIAFFDANADGDRDHPGDELIVQMEARSPGFSFSQTPNNVYQNLIYFSDDGISITPANVPISGTVNVSYGSDEKRDITVAANGRVSTLTPPVTP